jgi:hypothetical protein
MSLSYSLFVQHWGVLCHWVNNIGWNYVIGQDPTGVLYSIGLSCLTGQDPKCLSHTIGWSSGCVIG